VKPLQDSAKRQLILEAGLIQFAQFGLRKTSMQEIAERAGISRASLYSYFKNKDEIFRCVSVDVHEGALGRASRILQDRDEPNLVTRIADALYARHGRFLTLVLESGQGAELEDEYCRLCGDVVIDYSRRFKDQLELCIDIAVSSGELDLTDRDLTADRIATVLNLSAAGCKRGCVTMDEYFRRIEDLVTMMLGGLLKKTP
jgi:AcrR family transcriptional regulator